MFWQDIYQQNGISETLTLVKEILGDIFLQYQVDYFYILSNIDVLDLLKFNEI